MLNKLKKYLEYRRNKKIVKREIATIGATFLPIVSNASSISKDIILFISKLSKELNTVDNEKFLNMLLNELSNVLQTDNERIVEILRYIAQLSPKEINTIITDAMVNTMDS